MLVLDGEDLLTVDPELQVRAVRDDLGQVPGSGRIHHAVRREIRADSVGDPLQPAEFPLTVPGEPVVVVGVDIAEHQTERVVVTRPEIEAHAIVVTRQRLRPERERSLPRIPVGVDVGGLPENAIGDKPVGRSGQRIVDDLPAREIPIVEVVGHIGLAGQTSAVAHSSWISTPADVDRRRASHEEITRQRNLEPWICHLGGRRVGDDGVVQDDQIAEGVGPVDRQRPRIHHHTGSVEAGVSGSDRRVCRYHVGGDHLNRVGRLAVYASQTPSPEVKRVDIAFHRHPPARPSGSSRSRRRPSPRLSGRRRPGARSARRRRRGSPRQRSRDPFPVPGGLLGSGSRS